MHSNKILVFTFILKTMIWQDELNGVKTSIVEEKDVIINFIYEFPKSIFKI